MTYYARDSVGEVRLENAEICLLFCRGRGAKFFSWYDTFHDYGVNDDSPTRGWGKKCFCMTTDKEQKDQQHVISGNSFCGE